MENKKIDILEELAKKSLDVEKLKYCYECNACTTSCPAAWIFPRHFNPRFLLQKISLGSEEVLNEVGLWMCTKCYQCYQRCPRKFDLPEIFSATRDIAIEWGYVSDAKSRIKEVMELLRSKIPLAAVYGWLSIRPPEEGNGLSEDFRKFLEDYAKQEVFPPPLMHEERIAVIGSGPAGLTAAYILVKMGYAVTVFESLPETGGMSRVGIPRYRLPKNMLDFEIRLLKEMGVEIETNTTIGKDLTIEDLFRGGFKAVFLATGAHKSRELRIEGENLEGVIHALDLLKRFNLDKKVKLGDKAVVIGGGNVAIDTARTALRLGAKEVTILYRRSRAEMPASPREVKEAEEEGVKIQFLVAPSRILGEDGKVAALECIRMELGEFDESGRRRPVPIKGSEFIIRLDTLIPAIGEVPDVSTLSKKIEIAHGNTIKVNPLTLETSLPGVFSGGDAVSGPATVIEAIGAGVRGAFSINRYLKKMGDSE